MTLATIWLVFVSTLAACWFRLGELGRRRIVLQRHEIGALPTTVPATTNPAATHILSSTYTDHGTETVKSLSSRQHHFFQLDAERHLAYQVSVNTDLKVMPTRLFGSLQLNSRLCSLRFSTGQT